MKRTRYLLAYDIRDPVRLRHVHKIVRGFGETMQYSVFVCDLTSAERMDLIVRLEEVVDTTIDRVALVTLGQGGSSDMFWFMGESLPLPADGSQVY
jgi:CRISPR-associated protein Cas2